MKQNGFSRRNFRSILFKLYPSLKIKKYAINGKIHAFGGIRMKIHPPTLPKSINEFVATRCKKGECFRVKNTELYEKFSEFVKEKYNTSFGRTLFYKKFDELNPQLIKKHVTKMDKGYVGILVK